MRCKTPFNQSNSRVLKSITPNQQPYNQISLIDKTQEYFVANFTIGLQKGGLDVKRVIVKNGKKMLIVSNFFICHSDCFLQCSILSFKINLRLVIGTWIKIRLQRTCSLILDLHCPRRKVFLFGLT